MEVEDFKTKYKDQIEKKSYHFFREEFEKRGNIKDLGRDEWGQDYKCPICEQGIITYWKDETTGFKDWGFTKCNNCEFTLEELMWEKPTDKLGSWSS
jgi:hypothetical protein